MARIKLGDLPKDAQISQREMREIFGGILTLRDLSITPLASRIIRGVRWHEGLREEEEYERVFCTD